MTDTQDFQFPARKLTTAKLNSILASHEDQIREGKPGLYPFFVEAIQAEKDRRLSDPNSPDFRPTFF